MTTITQITLSNISASNLFDLDKIKNHLFSKIQSRYYTKNKENAMHERIGKIAEKVYAFLEREYQYFQLNSYQDVADFLESDRCEDEDLRDYLVCELKKVIKKMNGFNKNKKSTEIYTLPNYEVCPEYRTLLDCVSKELDCKSLFCFPTGISLRKASPSQIIEPFKIAKIRNELGMLNPSNLNKCSIFSIRGISGKVTGIVNGLSDFEQNLFRLWQESPNINANAFREGVIRRTEVLSASSKDIIRYILNNQGGDGVLGNLSDEELDRLESLLNYQTTQTRCLLELEKLQQRIQQGLALNITDGELLKGIFESQPTLYITPNGDIEEIEIVPISRLVRRLEKSS